MKILTTILRLSRPIYLLLATLTYLLGVGLAAYLGHPFSPLSFWLGLLDVLLALISMLLLTEVFRPAADPILPNENLSERGSLRDVMLYSGIACLAAAVVSISIINNSGHLSTSTLFLNVLLLVLVLLYAIPPLRLVNRGFGEPVLAVQLAYLIPSIGFLLQAASYHRFLAMIVFPLTALALASFIALDFPSYARDRKYNRGTLLARIGWERAVPVHNVLIVAAYLILLAAPLFGISLALVWPGFLTLPFAVFQILSLRNIVLGGKPIWTMLTVTALAVFALTAYFLTLTFWLR
jgi:1,4-dihydroxy-2-naphthoate octaprenyltransferase